MVIRFWGCPGSIPVPGRATNRYGGNTSCVEVRPEGEPPIIIDAGTGIRKLGKLLLEESFGDGRGKASILISHTHWDHVQGLPFFSPLYRAGNEVHVFARERDVHLEAVFSQQHDAPYFPVPLSAMHATMSFHGVSEGAQFDIGRAKVTSARLNHPSVAIAYRVDADGASVVYCSDTAPFSDMILAHEFVERPPSGELPIAILDELLRMREGIVALAKDADLLIYDTQFTPEEYRRQPHWGHSRPDDAIEIAMASGAKRLCLYHHAPMRSDDANDAILAGTRAAAKAKDARFDVISAFEGLEVTVGDA